jgi:hypothetical protein
MLQDQGYAAQQRIHITKACSSGSSGATQQGWQHQS